MTFSLRSSQGGGVVPAPLLGMLLVFALLLGACGDASAAALAGPPAELSKPDPAPPPPIDEPEPVAEVTLPRGAPVRVLVEAIDVDASLVALGLADDGAMEVPDFGLASWYDEGPPPGHPGPAVVAAHVDSRSGPDVFYRLRDLQAGDLVVVVYDSGDEAHFEVVRSERTDKDELPGDDIWPVTTDPLLTLITCGGEFDRSIGHYRDNIVVYTVPVADTPVVLAS